MNDPGYFRYPTIHGDTIVFTCEDDLWSVPTSGGMARRLTAGTGECSMPKLSPDGKMIAFVGRDEGHPEVFVMPSNGGLPRRLTYLGADTCQVCGWSSDGADVLFVTDAYSAFFRHSEAYAVSVKGGMPRSLELGLAQSFSIGKNAGKVIGRNSNDPARWKRYRGGTAGEIWVDATGKGKFVPLIELKGNMVLPMWVGNRVFFLSDHDGIGNIYSCRPDGADLVKHTHHSDYFVRFPSTDGRRIVYSAGADLYLLDPVEKVNFKIDVITPPATMQSMRKFVPARSSLEHVSPHPEGHSLAIISRGQPLTMANWEGAALQHGSGSRIRYRQCEWLKDGQRFVVLTDREGFEQLELHHADQSEEPRVITNSDMGRVIEMKVSPQADLIAIANHRHELLLVDVAKKRVKTLDRSEVDRIVDVTWSGDGRFIAYSYAPRLDVAVIRVVDVPSGQKHNVTDELRRDFAPAFDPEGKHLYFLSSRDFHPVYDSMRFDLSYPTSVRPMLVTLRKDVLSPFVQEPRPVHGNKKEKAADKTANAKSTAAAKSLAKEDKDGKPKAFEIDFDGIETRMLSFPVPEGRYEQLVAVKNRVFFSQFEVKGIKPDHSWYSDNNEMGTMVAFDFDTQRQANFQRAAGRMYLAMDNQSLFYRHHDRVRVVDALSPLPAEGQEPQAPSGEGRKSGIVDLDRAHVLVQPQQEWAQMYEEAWRLQREHFWDEGMSDVDWDLVHNRYAALLKRVRTRSELSDVIWEMHGELGTSHAYEFGGDYRWPRWYHKGCLGADLAYDEKRGGYKIERIIRGDAWESTCDSPLAVPGLQISEGDVIVAVNGRAVSRDCTVDELLLNNANQKVNLTLAGSKGKRRNVVVKTLRSERMLRYRNWVETNRKTVHERSKGRVGYVHIPDMGPFGFAEFTRGYLMEYDREGLIIDARYNRGGHVSSLLLEKLLSRRVGYSISRWGVPQPYPSEAASGAMVCLTNQFAGSDGDIFSHCFKLYKLGPLVGKRTWGGVIGIWPRHKLVDGTITTQPEFSFWFKDVGFAVENYGTDPDYEIDIAPQDYKDEKDPQMDKALALILNQLKANPVELPDFSDRPSLAIPPHKEPVSASRRKR